jgi:hypothetical protein
MHRKFWWENLLESYHLKSRKRCDDNINMELRKTEQEKGRKITWILEK